MSYYLNVVFETGETIVVEGGVTGYLDLSTERDEYHYFGSMWDKSPKAIFPKWRIKALWISSEPLEERLRPVGQIEPPQPEEEEENEEVIEEEPPPSQRMRAPPVDDEIRREVVKKTVGKPGWKTTEFYITALTMVGSALAGLAGYIPERFAAILSGASGLAYMGARSIGKIKAGQAVLPPNGNGGGQ